MGEIVIAGKLARYLVWALRRRILLPHEPASGIIVYHFAQTFPNPSPAPRESKTTELKVA